MLTGNPWAASHPGTMPPDADELVRQHLERGRQAQARYREKYKNQRETLTQQIEQTWEKIQEKKAFKEQLVLHRTEVAEHMLEVSSKAVQVSNACLAASQQLSAKAVHHKGIHVGDCRLKCASKPTLYEFSPIVPRTVDSYQCYASISYAELEKLVERNTAYSSMWDGADQSSKPIRNSHGSHCVSSSRERIPSRTANQAPHLLCGARHRGRLNQPIDTSSTRNLRGLLLQYTHELSKEKALPGEDICLFLETGLSISPNLRLAYSSTLGSKECLASVVVNYIAVAFEHSLFLMLRASIPYCNDWHLEFFSTEYIASWEGFIAFCNWQLTN